MCGIRSIWALKSKYKKRSLRARLITRQHPFLRQYSALLIPVKCRIELVKPTRNLVIQVWNSRSSSQRMADVKPTNKIKQVMSVGSSQKSAEAAVMAGNHHEMRLTMVQMCMSWIYPAVIRTIVQLNVPQILAKNYATISSHGEKMGMTAAEILEHMMKNLKEHKKQEELAELATLPNALNLERLLRLLTTKGIFAEHIDIVNNSEEEGHNVSNGCVERRFALTPLSRCLVPGDGSLHNAALFFTLGPEYAATLEYLGDVVLKSEEPFTNAHGMNQFEYMKSHPAFLATFKNAMTDMSTDLVPVLLSKYHGFEGVRRLVDVGGSSGKTLASIVHKYPHIHAINFDLPEVVATNPNLPGVEQVGGDMFEKVPSGCDAIYMKGILHDWNDEQCIKILKNCWTALPNAGGKLIMLDQIMPMETPLETSLPIEKRTVFQVDSIMQVHCASGRERTTMELEGLLKQVGFTSFQVVSEVVTDVLFIYIMEAFK